MTLWHPLLFSAPMILAVRREVAPKTETRRIAKIPPTGHNGGKLLEVVPSLLANRGDLFDARYEMDNPRAIRSPYGAPGDMLWCRERTRVVQTFEPREGRVIRVRYEADGPDSEPYTVAYPARLATPKVGKCLAYGGHREASRTTLEILALRIERLQDITDDDIRAEGITRENVGDLLATVRPRRHFPIAHDWRSLWALGWDAINGKRAPWASNPWVWVIGFKRVEVARA